MYKTYNMFTYRLCLLSSFDLIHFVGIMTSGYVFTLLCCSHVFSHMTFSSIYNGLQSVACWQLTIKEYSLFVYWAMSNSFPKYIQTLYGSHVPCLFYIWSVGISLKQNSQRSLTIIVVWKCTNVKHSVLYNSVMIVIIVLDSIIIHECSSVFIKIVCYHVLYTVVRIFFYLCLFVLDLFFLLQNSSLRTANEQSTK